MKILSSDLQEVLEKNYFRQHTDQSVTEFLEKHYPEVIQQGADFLKLWLKEVEAECLSPKKIERLQPLHDFDLRALVVKIFTMTAYEIHETQFTNISAKAAGVLGFSDKGEAILTCAEILAVLAHTGAFSIWKVDKRDNLSFKSNFQLSEQIIRYIGNVRFNLPMACKPNALKTNQDSPYLTVNDRLILGKGNLHGGDISLDVLNKQNAIPLKLNTQFLSTVEEVPKKDWETQQQQDNWDQFKQESYELYSLVAKQYGNVFYLPNSVDKRGRMYARGYHISTQGTSFKKSSIDFAKEAFVEGIPDHLKNY